MQIWYRPLSILVSISATFRSSRTAGSRSSASVVTLAVLPCTRVMPIFASARQRTLEGGSWYVTKNVFFSIMVFQNGPPDKFQSWRKAHTNLGLCNLKPGPVWAEYINIHIYYSMIELYKWYGLQFASKERWPKRIPFHWVLTMQRYTIHFIIHGFNIPALCFTTLLECIN